MKATTVATETGWRWSVRELLDDGTHGRELGVIRKQGALGDTSGAYGYSAWAHCLPGLGRVGHYARRQDARAALLLAVAGAAR